MGVSEPMDGLSAFRLFVARIFLTLCELFFI